jgi:hypothetical protein
MPEEHFFDHFYLFSDFPEVAPDSVAKGFLQT